MHTVSWQKEHHSIHLVVRPFSPRLTLGQVEGGTSFNLRSQRLAKLHLFVFPPARVRLSKRRGKTAKSAMNSKLVVKHREMVEDEIYAQVCRVNHNSVWLHNRLACICNDTLYRPNATVLEFISASFVVTLFHWLTCAVVFLK